MSRQESDQDQGHFLSKLGLDKFLLNYYKTSFRVHGGLHERAGRLLARFDLVSRAEVEALGERLDRIEGLLLKRAEE